MNNRVDELGDEELAERTRGGDRDAYGVLWNRHAHAGLAAARQFRSIADPDDIVSEAYLQIFRALQRGGGPHEGFRPYLYRTVRNVALGWNQKAGPEPVELPEDLEVDGPSVEDAVLEKTITVRAFRTLPDRWQSILWYTEVEGMDPAEAAPFLGLTPNSAAALAYRAREGLKKAWLQAHVNDERVPEECRWTTARMGDYNRGGLTPRARKRFEAHLETCTRCSILVEEVDQIGGRLAIILLPLVLGGAAATGLLADAQPASAATASASPRPGRRARHLTGVAAGAAVIAVIGAAAFGLPGLLGPSPSTSSADGSSSTNEGTEGNEPAVGAPAESGDPATDPEPVPAPEPVPTGEAPATDPAADTTPETPVVVSPIVDGLPGAPTAPGVPPAPTSPAPTEPVPPSPPVDTTAPLAPVVSTPTDGTLTNDNRPTFTGSGEPGASVTVAEGGATIASTIVGPDGRWQARPAAPVPDGDRTFVIRQADAAGNSSPTVSTTFTIDTVALAPTIEALTDPLLYLPTLTGAGEPGATLVVTDDTGAVIGSTTVADDGTWSVPVPDPRRDGAVLSAVQSDRAGNVSAASTPTSPLRFDRPSFLSPGQGATIPSTGGSTSVSLEVTGTAGMTVEFLIDGVSTGNRHTLTPGSITRVTPPLADGAHTVSVRYIDAATGAVGSVATLAFTIVP